MKRYMLQEKTGRFFSGFVTDTIDAILSQLGIPSISYARFNMKTGMILDEKEVEEVCKKLAEMRPGETLTRIEIDCPFNQEETLYTVKLGDDKFIKLWDKKEQVLHTTHDIMIANQFSSLDECERYLRTIPCVEQLRPEIVKVQK